MTRLQQGINARYRRTKTSQKTYSMQPSIIINFNHHTLLPRPDVSLANSGSAVSTLRAPAPPIPAFMRLFFLLDMPLATVLEDDGSRIVQTTSFLQILPHFKEKTVNEEILRPSIGTADRTLPLVW